MRIANLDGLLALVVDDTALDVESASNGLFSADPQAIYSRWEEFLVWAASADKTRAEAFVQADLRAPVPAPAQIFGIGLNYRDHAAESGLDLPTSPPASPNSSAR